jgi:hypothetical protein
MLSRKDEQLAVRPRDSTGPRGLKEAPQAGNHKATSRRGLFHMRIAKILGLAFLAILAINAIALTATASAVLLTTFLPVPTAEKPVTFIIKGGSGELVPLGEELKGKSALNCSALSGSGELNSATLGNGGLNFNGCKFSGGQCEDLTDKVKEQVLVKGEFHIFTGLLEKKEVPVLVVLPNNTHFTCGIVLFLFLQSKEDPSCVAGEILEPNKLLSKLKVDIKEEKGTKGDQDILEIWDPKDEKLSPCKLFFNISEGKLLDGAIVENEEVTLEKFKQGIETTVLIDF